MSDTNFTAVITPDSITLLDGSDELVMWDKAEWVEDSTLVPAIANAIHIGYTEGPDGIRARLIVGNFANFDGEDEDRTDKDWWEADYRILDAAGNVVKQGTEQVIADDEEGAGYLAWCGLDGRTLDESGTGKVVIDAVRKI